MLGAMVEITSGGVRTIRPGRRQSITDGWLGATEHLLDAFAKAPLARSRRSRTVHARLAKKGIDIASQFAVSAASVSVAFLRLEFSPGADYCFLI